ncbi:LysR family transcriptional regulator [Oricola sp.]|uniref:LysR family transcriptional regulator n=1 Tax=Oricola sp. TaxID=1979950 RepID=UPI0025EC2A79|nr:LysR family transcriptional regulator [Oricola sp.]MCI5076626.1 LysR family transcriptional regulator [Oricola sp.]
MNLRSFLLFRHIVLTGSLSLAAKRLNVSASAASRMLTQLEDQVGLTLFSRSRRNLKLTEDGALFYRQISNTLDGLEEVPSIADDIKRRARSWLSVVTAAPLANALVVPTVARLREAGLDFQCTLHIESRFEIESKVAARGYNLGFISLPVENEIIPLDIMPLLRSRLCVLMPEGHPLSGCDEVELERLEREELVTLASGQRWRSRLDDVMGEAGLKPRIAFETGSTLVTLEMVRHGLGLTLADPACLTASTLQGLAMRPLEGEHWTTYASIHAKGPRAELSEVFLDTLSAHVEAQRAADREIAETLYLI